jgi:hypothetical protein
VIINKIEPLLYIYKFVVTHEVNGYDNVDEGNKNGGVGCNFGP